jgi:ABC-type transporter Mla subunit MlaD
MNPTDVAIEILKSIRDDVHVLAERQGETNARLDETNVSLAETNARLDQTRNEIRAGLAQTNARLDTLSRRVVESEVRTATAITDLHGTVRDMVDVLRIQHDLRPRLDHAERDITEIKNRLGM